MKFALVNLAYPYGKSQTYFNAGLATVAATLLTLGHEVEYIDFNLDSINDPRLINADVIAVSVYGAPYVPEAVKFAQRIGPEGPPILIGGQVIDNLSEVQFTQIFSGTNARQIKSITDLAEYLHCTHMGLPNSYRLSLRPVWEGLTPERRLAYFSHEMPLRLSQGCKYQCAFCAAQKSQREMFFELTTFENDLRYLAASAKTEGLEQIHFYATSLDFFQNPTKITEYLEILAQVQKEVGIRIRVRCLCCMRSFLRANEEIPNFSKLIKRSGLNCIGFGVDGTDLSVWRAQKKFQNKLHEAQECLDLCEQIGIHVEVLLVMGFPEDTLKSLIKTVWSAVRFLMKWHDVSLRPYLAKAFVPGNDEWKTAKEVEQLINTPQLFYNLDFCAVGSQLTHPRRFHRYLSNAAYLSIIGIAAMFKRTDTYPLLPQGEAGLYGRIARIVNRLMPFDR